MKTRGKKKKKKVRKIRIIVSLLLTTNAERMHNIPSTHFDLQLHLYNFFFLQAATVHL